MQMYPNHRGSVWKHGSQVLRILIFFLLLYFPSHCSADADKQLYSLRNGVKETAVLRIPKIDRAPKLEEFLEMRPAPAWEGKLATVKGFIQRLPDDGQPATEATEAYLGYDAKALHIVFIAHDHEPHKVRARLDHRETIAKDEDEVGIYLDTFLDRHRAYVFSCNPLGVQDDAMYSQDSDTTDEGFDTVWTSQGKLTSEGYVLLMSIPFKSLRFPHETSQTWNVALWRYIGRRSEGSWWPRVSSQYRGILGQTAPATGIEGISPGHNLQLIPYTSTRAYHSVDVRDPSNPVYTGKSAEILTGLDAKAVLKDSLVLDMTIKPDFRQIESDDPQTTTNQLYSLYYPEKRPFFTENANYFEAPMVTGEHLLYTRTIVDPDFGARLTGKKGAYSIGSLFADDRSPGESVPVYSPVAGKKAYFEIFRLTHDLPAHSNVGIGFGERRFANSYSRVTNIDTTFNIGRTWEGSILAGYDWNRALDGTTSAGGDVDANLTRVSRSFNYIGYLINRAPGFQPAMAFYSHSNWREVGQTFAYQFWPKNSCITRVWAEVYGARNWHYNGYLFWEGVKPMVKVDIKHNTTVGGYLWRSQDAFTSEDFPVLQHPIRFPLSSAYGAQVQSTQARFLTFKLWGEWGTRSNVAPVANQPPVPAKYQQAEADLSILTAHGLTINNSYLFDRNAIPGNGQPMYNAHIFRSNWNWQLNRELSVRFIGQYNATLANPLLTSTATARDFNADFLITYLVHPGTALYVGYNSNLSKPGPAILSNDPNRFVNDSRQLFVKVSYLFRF